MSAGAGPGELDALRRRLAEHRPERIAPGQAEQRAAVALLLRPPGGNAGRSARLDELLALFIRRAEIEGDPWSGHMGLPGGRMEPGDRDLRETARRETLEETGIRLSEEDLLGRLSDLHPRSPHLPSVAIAPYVARHLGGPEVRPSVEVSGHLWVPVRELRDPSNRSELTLERRGERRTFPTIEVEGRTIWGLTYEIVRRFLALAGG
ncbi:MAG: CoA pyrophosphatase [Gemmatimonadota bacterium]